MKVSLNEIQLQLYFIYEVNYAKNLIYIDIALIKRIIKMKIST